MQGKVPSYQMIEAFRAVIQYGGMSAAGEALDLSQSSISRLIAQLQKILGYQLFAKHGRRVKPTVEALALMGKVQQAFLGLEDIAKFSEQLRKQRMGRLSIFAMPAFGYSILPAAIDFLRKKHADVHINLTIAPSIDVAQAVRNRQADLGFALHGPYLGDLETVAEFKGNCVCIGGTGGMPKNSGYVTVSQLGGRPFVGTLGTVQKQLETLVSDAGSQLNVFTEVSHSQTASQLVLRGLGISVVDPFTGTLHKAQGGAVLPLRPPLPFTVVALAMEDTRLSVAAKDLLSFVATAVRAATRSAG
jgi:DNA-binding transcriptional LysR family regulator